MDGQRFDALTKALASGTSRRSLAKGLLGGAGALLVGLGRSRSSAAQTDTSATPVAGPITGGCPGFDYPGLGDTCEPYPGGSCQQACTTEGTIDCVIGGWGCGYSEGAPPDCASSNDCPADWVCLAIGPCQTQKCFPKCRCSSGLYHCAGRYINGAYQDWCADLSSDPNNCGVCGFVCSEGETCVNGSCPGDVKGTLIVRKVDESGQPLPGACFEVFNDAGNGARGNLATGIFCPDTGTMVASLDPGNYVLAETLAPQGYTLGPDTAFAITAGQTTDLTIADALGGATLIVHTDPPLAGCFYLYTDAGNGAPGAFVSFSCTGGAGPTGASVSGLPTGTVAFPGLAAGNYVVTTHGIFEGGTPNAVAAVSLAAGQTLEITLHCDNNLSTCTLSGSSTGGTCAVDSDCATGAACVNGSCQTATGTLVVHKADQNGQPLSGACFSIFHDAGNGARGGLASGSQCVNTGTLTTSLPIGSYVLVETLAPQGYILSPDTAFAITADQTADLTVTDAPGGATLLVHTDPALNTCFHLYTDAGNGTPGAFVAYSCAYYINGLPAGTVPFYGLAAGNYVVTIHGVSDAMPPNAIAAVSLAAGQTLEITLHCDDSLSTCAIVTGPTTCPSGQTLCNNVCTDVSSDPQNCRACGTVCPTLTNGTATCSNSTCDFTCNAGYTKVNGACVPSTTSGCASSNKVCTADTDCSLGTHEACCPNASLGTHVCTNTSCDPKNCGRCGKTCPSGQACINGKCTNPRTPCRTNETACGDNCCAQNETCASNGVCVPRTAQLCPPTTKGSCQDDLGCDVGAGEICCAHQCVNPVCDLNNCGQCGKRCPSGQTCLYGTCVAPGTCPPATTKCGTSDTTCCGVVATCDNGVCSFPEDVDMIVSIVCTQTFTGSRNQVGYDCSLQPIPTPPTILRCAEDIAEVVLVPMLEGLRAAKVIEAVERTSTALDAIDLGTAQNTFECFSAAMGLVPGAECAAAVINLLKQKDQPYTQLLVCLANTTCAKRLKDELHLNLPLPCLHG